MTQTLSPLSPTRLARPLAAALLGLGALGAAQA